MEDNELLNHLIQIEEKIDYLYKTLEAVLESFGVEFEIDEDSYDA